MIKNYLNKFSLKNKKAFIIGGCGLLGEKITEAVFSAGAEVIILDINNKKGKKIVSKYNNRNLKYYYFDISNLNKLEINFNRLINKHGCPDIFINCAYPVTSDWVKNKKKKNTLSILRKNVDIHQNSSSWLGFKICKIMQKKKIKGSVIMFGSTYGILGQSTNLYKGTRIKENMNYAIIKGGIINLSRQLASYYGKFGIRINTLCPGGIKGHVKGSSKKQDKIFIKKYSSLCPLNRLGEADEIALSVIFLASDASSYITGTTFMVDGGWSAI